MKEQGKIPEQLNEVEVSNLLEKEFSIMIMKMTQNFRRRMEEQIEKIKEIFNNDPQFTTYTKGAMMVKESTNN